MLWLLEKRLGVIKNSKNQQQKNIYIWMYVVELKRENIHHGIFFEPIVLKYEIACSGTILIPQG